MSDCPAARPVAADATHPQWADVGTGTVLPAGREGPRSSRGSGLRTLPSRVAKDVLFSSARLGIGKSKRPRAYKSSDFRESSEVGNVAQGAARLFRGGRRPVTARSSTQQPVGRPAPRPAGIGRLSRCTSDATMKHASARGSIGLPRSRARRWGFDLVPRLGSGQSRDPRPKLSHPRCARGAAGRAQGLALAAAVSLFGCAGPSR
jgi:hypothetical protein